MIIRLIKILPCVSFIEEKNLKQRISDLLKYRRNGITKLEGKAHYDHDHMIILISHVFSLIESAEFEVLAQEQEKLQETKVHYHYYLYYYYN